MKDRQLIESVLAGDRKAYEALVRKYQGAVFGLALQRLGNASTAEDVAQDVFVTAFGKLPQLKDHAKFGAWLRSITLRRAGLELRAQGREPGIRRLAGGEEPSDAKAPDSMDEGFFEIESLIQELPRGLRAAAVLCLTDGLSPSEAAGVLGIKPGAVRKRLHGARAKLQRRIVEKAEKELQQHLLPEDFADRCVCRCGKGQKSESEKGGATMEKEKKDKKKKVKKGGCGCGCMEPSKDKAKKKSRKD